LRWEQNLGSLSLFSVYLYSRTIEVCKGKELLITADQTNLWILLLWFLIDCCSQGLAYIKGF